MSIGEEASKGNEVTKEAFRLLSGSRLTFKGNIEGHDLFEGFIDVAVCDGFVGNVVLKTSESVAGAIGAVLKREFSRNFVSKVGAMLLWNSLKELKRKMDPELSGGAPLLGVNGTCIITHGASSRRAIFHAIRVVCESLDLRVNQQIVEGLKENGF
jgi:glycerol-3-phosphate acyltransferase PlsX